MAIIERNILDAIRKSPDNKGKDLAVVDLAERAMLASGLVIPSLVSKTAEMVATHRAPAVISVETPEIEEWWTQTDRFIDLGFHDALGYRNPDDYRLTVPKFFPKPRTYEGSFDKPLAVEKRIPFSKLHQLMGVREIIDTNGITNQRPLPKKPYTVYIANSVETVTGTFDSAMSQLTKNAFAANFIEVDMAYLRYPEFFQTWLDAGDSRGGADDVPYLYVDGVEPKVFARWALYPNGHWRLLSRGKKIGT